MGYSAEVVRRARDRLAQAREDGPLKTGSTWRRPMSGFPGFGRSTGSCA